ncbi:MAG: ABC transporter ATP-binding protein [Candidatus Nanoarchaeia archaeon]|nr:ABC transporter ATP-binding protein [Candidatus Nanoarchaeia archaeon]
MADVIEIKGVSKSFGNKSVIEKLDLAIPKGKIVGIIGASGSGKTTLLKLITGYYKPDKGNVFYEGANVNHNLYLVKKNIGFATQENSFYTKLSIQENLEYFGSLYNMKSEVIKKNIDKVLPLLELDNARYVIAENLSDGMQRRFDLACALINYPKVLMMDEPTEDLDPPLRRKVLKLIRDLNSVGTTIIITSHLLSEVEDLCDYIAVLHEGKVVRFGTIEQLRDIFGEGDEIHFVTESQRYDAVEKYMKSHAKSVKIENGVLILRAKNAEVLLKLLLGWAKKKKEKVIYADVKRPSLEEVFEVLTKKK